MKKRLRKVVRAGAKVLSVAAPIAGGLVFGPAGAAAGTAVGAGFSQVGGGKHGRKRKALRRTLTVGGASILGAGALSLAGGGGLTTGAASNIQSIFGGSATPAENANGIVTVDQLAAQAGTKPTPGGGLLEEIAGIFGGGSSGPLAAPGVRGEQGNGGSQFGSGAPGGGAREETQENRNRMLLLGGAVVLLFVLLSGKKKAA